MLAAHCSFHASLLQEEEEEKKQKHNLHTHARIKTVMQHSFSVNKREHTEKERESGIAWEMTGRREEELESEGLTAGWYSWGLAREADGAEWTSPRNFNVDGTACCCHSQSCSLYVTDLTVWQTTMCLIEWKPLRSVKLVIEPGCLCTGSDMNIFIIDWPDR